MAVRLKDIARDLGVSVVTVSKVLRGNTDIGEATRKRVLKRMKERWDATWPEQFHRVVFQRSHEEGTPDSNAVRGCRRRIADQWMGPSRP
jgi:transcriptional regulator with XRE-family HTH domain